MSPRWETLPGPIDGVVEHQLDGRRAGAVVMVDIPNNRTVITVALLVDGTDADTVWRAKQRAERMIVQVQHGEVRS